MKPLYLDGAATRAVPRSVLKAMEPYFLQQYGNPSSSHARGTEARKALDSARTALARALGAQAHEIIFTSGATESNNLALLGVARAHPSKKKLIISAIEHASIIEPCTFLEKQGYEIVRVPVDSQGLVDMRFLEKAIDTRTLVVSIGHVNNVIGTIQDIARIGYLCNKKGVLFHTDATQSFGRLAINVRNMHVDLLSASGHKLGAPKGIGLLFVRDGIALAPLVYGGGQERGLRSGTENVAGAVGFAEALRVVKPNIKQITLLRDSLMEQLEALGGVINGSREHRLYNTIHVSFAGCDASMLVARLSAKGIYISTGSACETRGEQEDHVLKAMGLSKERVRGSVRMTLGDDFKKGDGERVVNAIEDSLRKS